jgi:hypothetical protein
MSNVDYARMFRTDIRQYLTGERRFARLAPFYDTLVADGFTTSADHARQILTDTGVYESGIVNPDQPQKDKNGKNTDHRRAMMRVSQGIREAIKRASGDDSEESDDKPVNLLTRAGLAASLEDVTAAWHAAQQ